MKFLKELLETVQLNEYFIKNGVTFKQALEALTGGIGDINTEIKHLQAEGWSKAATQVKSVIRMRKESLHQMRNVLRKRVPDSAIDALDQQANLIWDHIGLPGDGSEKDYIKYSVTEKLTAMDMLTTIASKYEKENSGSKK